MSINEVLYEMSYINLVMYIRTIEIPDYEEGESDAPGSNWDDSLDANNPSIDFMHMPQIVGRK